jgi:hypothetical protein
MGSGHRPQVRRAARSTREDQVALRRVSRATSAPDPRGVDPIL